MSIFWRYPATAISGSHVTGLYSPLYNTSEVVVSALHVRDHAPSARWLQKHLSGINHGGVDSLVVATTPTKIPGKRSHPYSKTPWQLVSLLGHHPATKLCETYASCNWTKEGSLVFSNHIHTRAYAHTHTHIPASAVLLAQAGDGDHRHCRHVDIHSSAAAPSPAGRCGRSTHARAGRILHRAGSQPQLDLTGSGQKKKGKEQAILGIIPESPMLDQVGA